jgi:hypothetical protein
MSLALFDNLDEADQSPARSSRSRNRAAAWEADLHRTYAYLSGQCRTDADRAQLDALFERASAEGPDFINYRAHSSFMAAPKAGIDRNAYARLLNALEMIERGTYRHARAKGKQGIPRTVARVFKALLGFALRFGFVYPSQKGIAHAANVCKQTVVNALEVLELYGFVTRHRRIKRIRGAFGVKVVQDSNAYELHEPSGLGAIALKLFGASSESKSCSPSINNSYPIKAKGQNFSSPPVPDGVYETLQAAWEAA